MNSREQGVLLALVEQHVETRRAVGTVIVQAAVNARAACERDNVLIDLASLKRQQLVEQNGETWAPTGQGIKVAAAVKEGKARTPAPAATPTKPASEKRHDTLAPRSGGAPKPVTRPTTEPAPASAPVEQVDAPTPIASGPAPIPPTKVETELTHCDCGRRLTADEVNYYGVQCERCVQADHKALQDEGRATYAAQGRKDDGEKLRMDLLFTDMPLALAEVVDVLTQGARKYEPGNWQYVPDASRRYLAATLRHELALAQGQVRDDETNCHHLAHSICCDLFRLELALRESQGGAA